MLQYHKSGCTVDFVPTVDVAAGQPVDLGGGIIGVPATPISANTLGAFKIAGIHRVSNAGGEAVAAGAVANYDVATGQLAAAGLAIGNAVLEILATDTGEVEILLNNRVG